MTSPPSICMKSGSLITPTSNFLIIDSMPSISSSLFGTIFDMKNIFDITNPKSLAKIWLQFDIFSGLITSTLCFTSFP